MMAGIVNATRAELLAVRNEIVLRRDELEREELSRIFWIKKRKARS
ncbi:MAG: hypothetical protein METHP_01611 [Methanoregula sp. SKADARSKE-2]|nr:MAG: hypothetical protein METHP_01611 [Methanoregula sp. SKADARSKE-2]